MRSRMSGRAVATASAALLRRAAMTVRRHRANITRRTRDHRVDRREGDDGEADAARLRLGVAIGLAVEQRAQHAPAPRLAGALCRRDVSACRSRAARRSSRLRCRSGTLPVSASGSASVSIIAPIGSAVPGGTSSTAAPAAGRACRTGRLRAASASDGAAPVPGCGPGGRACPFGAQRQRSRPLAAHFAAQLGDPLGLQGRIRT